MTFFRTRRTLWTMCESFEQNWGSLFESMLRASPGGNIPVDENNSRALSCELGCRDCERVGSATETIGKDQDVGVTSRRDREGAEVIGADGNAGPFRQGHRDDGPTGRQPRSFPCLTLQAAVKPLPGAEVHTNPPVKMLGHSQSARVAEMIGSCRKASLHDPRAHEPWYVNTNIFIVQQKSVHPTGRCDSDGGCEIRRTRRTIPSPMACSRPLAVSS